MRWVYLAIVILFAAAAIIFAVQNCEIANLRLQHPRAARGVDHRRGRDHGRQPVRAAAPIGGESEAGSPSWPSAPSMSATGVGASVGRKEDDRFLRGHRKTSPMSATRACVTLLSCAARSRMRASAPSTFRRTVGWCSPPSIWPASTRSAPRPRCAASSIPPNRSWPPARSATWARSSRCASAAAEAEEHIAALVTVDYGPIAAGDRHAGGPPRRRGSGSRGVGRQRLHRVFRGRPGGARGRNRRHQGHARESARRATACCRSKGAASSPIGTRGSRFLP